MDIPREQSSRPYSIALVTLSALGFLDALFLSVEHFRGLIPPCTTGFQCDVVTTSAYSVVWGIPLPYLGLVYYLVLFVGSIYFLERSNKAPGRTLFFLRLLSGAGVLASAYFIYVQGAILHAWCLYCIFSAVITTCFHGTSHLATKKIFGTLF